MSFNIINITILRNISSKKIEIQMLHVCGDVYVEKINYQKENISADLVIWIKPSHYLEIPPTGCNILYFFQS